MKQWKLSCPRVSPVIVRPPCRSSSSSLLTYFCSLSWRQAFFIIAAPSNFKLVELAVPAHPSFWPTMPGQAVVACTPSLLQTLQGPARNGFWQAAGGMARLVVTMVVRRILPLTVPVLVALAHSCQFSSQSRDARLPDSHWPFHVRLPCEHWVLVALCPQRVTKAKTTYSDRLEVPLLCLCFCLSISNRESCRRHPNLVSSHLLALPHAGSMARPCSIGIGLVIPHTTQKAPIIPRWWFPCPLTLGGRRPRMSHWIRWAWVWHVHAIPLRGHHIQACVSAQTWCIIRTFRWTGQIHTQGNRNSKLIN